MSVFSGATLITEPEWQFLFDDALEIKAASDYWHRIKTELESRELLVAANLHAMKRLTIAYMTYDKAAAMIATQGAVLKPKKGNPQAIARPNPYFSVMRDSAIDSDRMEAELGLAPRRRASATKAENAPKPKPKIANGYLPARAVAAAAAR